MDSGVVTELANRGITRVTQESTFSYVIATATQATVPVPEVGGILAVISLLGLVVASGHLRCCDLCTVREKWRELRRSQREAVSSFA